MIVVMSAMSDTTWLTTGAHLVQVLVKDLAPRLQRFAPDPPWTPMVQGLAHVLVSLARSSLFMNNLCLGGKTTAVYCKTWGLVGCISINSCESCTILLWVNVNSLVLPQMVIQHGGSPPSGISEIAFTPLHVGSSKVGFAGVPEDRSHSQRVCL